MEKVSRDLSAIRYSTTDVKKRKCDSRSAERKRYSENRASTSFASNYITDKEQAHYKPIDPSKSWGDIMEEEDISRERKAESETRNMNAHNKPLAKLGSRKSKDSYCNSSVDSNKLFVRKYQSLKRKVDTLPLETDERKLAIRQRQIDIGKNTEGYRQYVKDVDRKDRTKDHPWTPDKFTACSTRSWQGVMRIWRRKLHFWDPPNLEKERENFLNLSGSTTDSGDCAIINQINNNMGTDADYCSSNENSPQDYNDEEDMGSFYKEHYVINLDGY